MNPFYDQPCLTDFSGYQPEYSHTVNTTAQFFAAATLFVSIVNVYRSSRSEIVDTQTNSVLRESDRAGLMASMFVGTSVLSPVLLACYERLYDIFNSQTHELNEELFGPGDVITNPSPSAFLFTAGTAAILVGSLLGSAPTRPEERSQRNTRIN